MNSRLWKPPRSLRLLAEHGLAALTPKFINGKYIGPLVSKRKAADIRKRSIIEGTFGSFSLPYGGWDPAWDSPKKMHLLKPQKGHERERTRGERANKITVAMKGMPERIAKYKQDILDKKPKKDIAYLFKRVKELSGKSHGKPGAPADER